MEKGLGTLGVKTKAHIGVLNVPMINIVLLKLYAIST